MKDYKSFFNNSAIQLTDLAYSVYEGILAEEHLLDRAKAYDYVKNRGKKGSIGGHNKEAVDHFISRFQNSALRISFVTINHKRDFDTISEWINTTFSIGKVKLLDLACGAGAGSLGLISTILSLRSLGQLDNLPLNIEILGADYSSKSLEYFEKVLSNFSKKLLGSSITLYYTVNHWDAECSVSSNELMDSFLDDNSDEYFVLLNNFSGASSSNDEIQQNLQRVIFSRLSRFSNKRCSLIWVEPHDYSGAKIISEFFTKLFTTPLRMIFQKEKIEKGKAEYQIYNRVQNIEAPSGVIVHSGRRGENEL